MGQTHYDCLENTQSQIPHDQEPEETRLIPRPYPEIPVPRPPWCS
jgi:hypothetical protein